MRSGDLDAFFDDLEKGVVKGARQLHKAIEKIRKQGLAIDGRPLNLSRIFPIIVTARRFPEATFVYDRIDEAL